MTDRRRGRKWPVNGRLTLYTMKAKAEHEVLLSAQGYMAFRQEFIAGNAAAWDHMVQCHDLMIDAQNKVYDICAMLGKMAQEEWALTPEGQEYLSKLGKEEDSEKQN